MASPKAVYSTFYHSSLTTLIIIKVKSLSFNKERQNIFFIHFSSDVLVFIVSVSYIFKRFISVIGVHKSL